MDFDELEFEKMLDNWYGFVEFPTEETLKKMKYKVHLENLFKPDELKKLTKYAKKRIKNLNNLYSIMLVLGMPLPSENALRIKVGLMPHRKLVCKPGSDNSDDDTTWKPTKRKSAKPNIISASELKKNQNFVIMNCLSDASGQKINLKNCQEEMSTLSKSLPSEVVLSLESRKAFSPKEKQIKNSSTQSSDDLQYKLRGIKKDFSELGVPDDDYYLYCDMCGKVYEGECLIHGPYLPIPDKKVKLGLCNRAQKTCPDGISIGPSKIRSGGLGAWAETNYKINSVFGPYEGVYVDKDDLQKLSLTFDGGYAWEIYRNGKLFHYVDGSDQTKSNWLRFVNCARNEEEQNLVAYQYKGYIYYRAYKEIKKGMELLVWYGNQYAEQLGIALKNVSINTPVDNFKFSNKHRQCMRCWDLFANDEALQVHLKSKHPDRSVIKRFKCHFCSYSSNNKSNFNCHIRTHTKEKPFECSHCLKRFSHKHSLTRHIRTHTGEKLHECNKCGKKLTRSSDLKKHIRTVHDKIKSYVCKVCGFMCGQESNLKKHYLTHTGVRNYKCQYCDKRFTLAGHLKKHERIHTGEKPYKCKECSYACKNSSNLHEHVIRLHSKKFPHKCLVCDKGFISPSKLKKHESQCQK